MSETTIKMSCGTYNNLVQYFQSSNERMAVLFGRTHGNAVIISDDHIYLFDDDCYDQQSSGHVKLNSDVNNHVHARFIMSEEDTYIHFHNHPFAVDTVEFSGVDNNADLDLAGYLNTDGLENIDSFRPHALPKITTISGVFGQNVLKLRSVSYDKPPYFTPIKHINILGERLFIDPANGSTDALAKRRNGSTLSAKTQRQVAFVGQIGQQKLGELRVLLAGCGGVGSINAEALARLGIGKLTLVDHDTVSESNLNRLVGAGPQDVGSLKTDVLKKHLSNITPSIKVKSIAENIFQTPPHHYAEADIIMSATDDSISRYYLNRTAIQNLTPLIDSGTIIDTEPAVNFRQRVSVVVPGFTACLECSAVSILDGHEIADAYASETEQALLREKGYVKGRPDIATPSVMALNLQVSGIAVQELLNLVFGWRPLVTNQYQEWVSGHHQRLDMHNLPDKPDPFCPCCGNYLAMGGIASTTTTVLQQE